MPSTENEKLERLVNKQQKQIRQLEEQVAKSKKDLIEMKMYYEGILALMPGHIYWLDKNNVFLGCNDLQAKDACLTSRDQIVGKTNYDMPWKEQADELNKLNNLVMQTGEPHIREEYAVMANGPATYLSQKVPLKDKNHNIVGVLGISLDITDRKKMEEELYKAKLAAEAASHAKTEFIANMSHDLRTPLTGIITFSRYLKEQDELTKEARKELAEDTYNASEQLLNLLNGVLEIVSADSATDNNVHQKSFDLMQMIDELIQLEKPAVKSHQLQLRKSIDKDIPKFIVSDKMKVHRILLNLIGNAIKFTEKGYIELAAKLQSKDDKKVIVVFSVKDTGIGIPEEAQPRIFERFFKVNSSYKGKYTGHGIGLHIVQKYVQMLGGEISFHSIFGKETTFFITLTFPIGKAPKEEIKDQSSYEDMLTKEQEDILLEEQKSVVNSITSTVDYTSSKKKILLVEDNLIALKSLRLLFMPFKFHIVEAENAEDAFELVKKEAFDLIITDIGLPEMQGDELIAKIRQMEKEEERQRGKIVALTGHAVDGELAKNCKKAGVDELFQKPLQPKFLENLLVPFLKKNEKPSVESPQEKSSEKKPASSGGKLGPDLPDTEEQLFDIDHYPLLDLKVGEEVFGSIDVAKDILKDLNQKGIIPELDKLKKAHADGDWDTVRVLAHKMKGGSNFGTVRLYYALLYMERYVKAGHSHCAEALYSQMFRVIDETMDYLDKHL